MPFVMKAGKALNERKTEIRVQFKPPTAPIHGEAENMRDELVVSSKPAQPSVRSSSGFFKTSLRVWALHSAGDVSHVLRVFSETNRVCLSTCTEYFLQGRRGIKCRNPKKLQARANVQQRRLSNQLDAPSEVEKRSCM